MEPLKIGVIGVGHMGRNHVRILSQEKRFTLVGVYDTNPAQAGEIADKYNTHVYDTPEELLDNVEAVVIAVPSSLHKQVATIAASKGVHALVEKPLATTYEDAREIVDVFASHGLKLAVGHVERFNSVFLELQKIMGDESIYYIEANRFSPYSSSGRITDTSVVEDLMIHDIDLVCALMKGKEVTSIHGRGESIRSNTTDFATCLIDFGDQTHAIVNASRVSQNKERSIKVHTNECYICADLLAKTLDIYKSTNITIDLSRDNSYIQDSLIQKVYVPIIEPLRNELEAFYEAVKNDTPVVVDGEMGARAVRICEEVSGRANGRK